MLTSAPPPPQAGNPLITERVKHHKLTAVLNTVKHTHTLILLKDIFIGKYANV